MDTRDTFAGTSLSSAIQYAKMLSVGDQPNSLIPGTFILFLSSRPKDCEPRKIKLKFYTLQKKIGFLFK